MRVSDLDDVAAVVGYTATRVLTAWYGGRVFHVPRLAQPDHPLVDLIGFPALKALCAEYAGEDLYFPRPSEEQRYLRDKAVAEMLASGSTVKEIAQRIGYSVRRVEQLRQDLVVRRWIKFSEGYVKRVSREAPGSSSRRPVLLVGPGI